MENDRQWETHGQIAGKSWGSVQDQGEVRSADAPQGPDAPLAPWNPFQIHPGDMMFHHVLFCVHRLKTLQVACGCIEMSTCSLPKPSIRHRQGFSVSPVGCLSYICQQV